MKLVVTRYYYDKMLREERREGEVLNVDESRAQVLINAGVAKPVEVIDPVDADAEPVAPVQPKRKAPAPAKPKATKKK